MGQMKIKDVRYLPFALDLKKPFLIKGIPLEKREGVIIEFASDQGIMGQGETSPLPGMSRELLKKALHQLERLHEELLATNLPLERDLLLKFMTSRFAGELLAPSVKFGIESAFISLAAGIRKVSVAQFLGLPEPSALPTAGLLQGAYRDVRIQMLAQRARGCRVFDLILGSRNIPLDVQKVEGLKELLSPCESLRIHSQGQWSFEEAVIFARSIGKNQIDFLSMPCPDAAVWERIYQETDIPLAWEFDQGQIDPDLLEGSRGISAIIIRPMIFGGVTGLYQLLSKARNMGKKVIVAGTFESPVGKRMLSNLAALTGEPAGLGGSEWLNPSL